MSKWILFLILIGLSQISFSQSISSDEYSVEFDAAYEEYPNIPRGLLEGVAYAQTRINHRTHDEPGCVGLPVVSGVMGLIEDGQGYFANTLEYVSLYSGFSAENLKLSPAKNIMGYAHAYSLWMSTSHVGTLNFEGHNEILRALSEIPKDDNPVNDFALNSFTYQVFTFMLDPGMQAEYGFPAHPIDLEAIYGENNYEMLTSDRIEIHEDGEILSADGESYAMITKSSEYGPALWNPTPTCNYSSRSGTAISAVTVHTVQGSYYGAISWAQNCISNVSYHYVVRSSDGQVTNMLLEADKGWHVGVHNPYTIGIEHEGWVDDPIWYTEAMYISSADLVRDITESGYGINPLRTFQGPATAGINVLGSCIKIKGHQHYSSGTHTDPGINWDWEHYYQLLNNTPSTSIFTDVSGSLFDSGGDLGNYSDDERELYLIAPPGAIEVTIDFVSFDLEEDWDYMYIYDGSSLDDPLLVTLTGGVLPTSITSSGGSILIEFRSDCATNNAGWEIAWTADLGGPIDITPPVTTVDLSPGWQTADFDVDFTDTDEVGGSGVDKVLYQLIDFDGTEWRANANHGFFSDNFDATIHPEWTSAVGTWGISSSVLEQSDEAENNTNLWADLNQDDYDTYLYHWQANISGAGSNKRAGFHFMCDDPALTNRGNSYFVWLREDDDKVQIYKVVADVFTLEQDIAYTIDADTWYDVKTVYDKPSGKIQVWINDGFVGEWTDASPYTTGNSISMRSGNCNYKTNNLKVYHNRSTTETVTLGAGGDFRYQNSSPSEPAGKIKSMIIDGAKNISGIADVLVDIDWTIPNDFSGINDGLGADIDVTYITTELSGNWLPVDDPHSGLQLYRYAIGTTPGGNDVVDWTDNYLDTTFTESGLTLSIGTTYYVSVYSINEAGLIGNTMSSDGVLVDTPTGPPTASFHTSISYVCAIDSIQMVNTSYEATSYSWSAPGATPSTSTDINPYFTFPTTGDYDVTLTATGPGGTDVITETLTIEVQPVPVASYTPSASVVSVGEGPITFTNTSTDADGHWWEFGDGNVSSDTSPWNEYMAEGTYDVMMIALSGTCPSDTVWGTIVVSGFMDINEYSGEEINIYPNPTTGEFQITNTSVLIYNETNLTLFNAQGQVIPLTIMTGEVATTIQLPEGIATGTYILQVIEGQRAQTVKVVVE
ncbi:MAG: N-acetylmuramoyl-L-alanine amidase [Crocinitomicaceae bacterium]|nr:N-acetylmuramoyl-L-alanine amidase [Crocinitomicaceae bacterium]